MSCFAIRSLLFGAGLALCVSETPAAAQEQLRYPQIIHYRYEATDPAKGGVLTNLNTLLPAEERYSYMFEGNAQQLDNILVTGGLVSGAHYDAVHINAEFEGDRPTDHDPQLALLQLGAAPTDLVLDHASVAENLPAGSVVGTLSATDTANDVRRWVQRCPLSNSRTLNENWWRAVPIPSFG